MLCPPSMNRMCPVKRNKPAIDQVRGSRRADRARMSSLAPREHTRSRKIRWHEPPPDDCARFRQPCVTDVIERTPNRRPTTAHTRVDPASSASPCVTDVIERHQTAARRLRTLPSTLRHLRSPCVTDVIERTPNRRPTTAHAPVNPASSASPCVTDVIERTPNRRPAAVQTPD